MLALLLAAQTGAGADKVHLESAGVRFGASLTSSHANFYQTEGFANLSLPVVFNLGTRWQAQSRLDLMAGSLSSKSDHGFVGTLGPSVVVRRERFPVHFEAGSGLTGLSRERYPTKDFGIPFQFTTHVGAVWRMGWHLDLAYRFQHMSNAGLGRPNPGLNLHLFALGYGF